MQFLYVPTGDSRPLWAQRKQLTVGRALYFTRSFHIPSSLTTWWGIEWRFFVPILQLRKLRLKEIKGLLQNSWLPGGKQGLCAGFHSPVQILLCYTASRSAGSFTHSIIHSLVDLTNAYKHIFYSQCGRDTGETVESQAKPHCHWVCGPGGEMVMNI